MPTPLALVLATLALTPASPPDDTGAADARAVADRMLSALVETNGVPGMGAAVVVDGEVRWRGSAGFRDLEAGRRVDENTVFRLASVSKLLTATAAAKLAEAGRLDLDAPVQSLLPWLDADWPPITPRQLAAHTSGLPHYQAIDADRGGRRFGSVREAVGVFSGRPLLSAPGERYEYSSWGYTLLSAVVEAGAGKPFLEVVTQDLAPGLAIGEDASDRGDPAASRTYEFVDGRVRRLAPHDFSYTWGGGGLAATPEAIAVFGARVLSGDVVSRETFDALRTPARFTDGGVVAERDFEVGFGWRRSTGLDGDVLAHHAGVTGGARSALVLWPDRGASASVLSNALWVSSIERTAEMLAAPFLPREGAPARGACPVGAAGYVAEFAGARFEGTATFTDTDGWCTGRLALPDGALRDWLDGFPQRDADALPIIGLFRGAGLARAALVTPIGLHALRADGDGRTLRVDFGPERTLVVSLR